jgi:NADP-dependent alcohol dehydrogenase
MHSIGVKTRLSEYTDDYEKSAAFIENRFTERGWKGLGERRDITPVVVKEIVERGY